MQRVVLITGCSSGIGRATALAFLDAEWDVVATSRNTSDIAALADAGCKTVTLDVRSDEQVRTVVDEVIDTFGQIDCLVNNAGFAQLGPSEDVSVDALHRQFDVNVYGPHRLARAVLPYMRTQERGTIINVSSVLGRIALPGTGIYSGSKFALEAISDAMRAETRSFGVNVVLIEPGNVDTRFPVRAGREVDRLDQTAAYAALYRLIDDWSSIGGIGATDLTPNDVAGAILNAASATDPDPRYAIGASGQAGTLLRFLPGRLRDRLYSTTVRLTTRLSKR